jgi:hypothetical protein
MCGRIGEKVTSNHSHMAPSNLCAKLFGFNPTVLGNLMEEGAALKTDNWGAAYCGI